MVGGFFRWDGGAGWASRRFGAAPGPRPSAYASMQPWQVRTQRFRAARFGRRGLDPGEVRAFLDRLATELTAQHEALRAARLEVARLGGEVRRLRAERARRPDAGRR
ncbi:DivIVA domain-containing protein [Micromonospora haikouensis]|uniref:DivIVA domain-containing protein n=1 Tax=Micromonospora haikouensis TaxID=686309 RepID=UPI0037BC674F